MEKSCNFHLNRAWKNTCRVLLGEEVGDLFEFTEYLKRHTDPLEKRKSVLTWNNVTISSNRVPQIARVIGYDEVEEYKRKTICLPFNINEIKDIDSIIRALDEKICYAGNIVLGNSSQVYSSHRCINTSYAVGCQDVYDGKYVAFTTSIRSPEYSFGCCFGGDIQFCIKVLDPYQQVRCMETFHCNVASDCYYSASLEDCTNCLFSFNQRHKHYLVGNVQLGREEYTKLKAKLVGEIVREFKMRKSLPSIIDIISGKGMLSQLRNSDRRRAAPAEIAAESGNFNGTGEIQKTFLVECSRCSCTIHSMVPGGRYG